VISSKPTSHANNMLGYKEKKEKQKLAQNSLNTPIKIKNERIQQDLDTLDTRFLDNLTVENEDNYYFTLTIIPEEGIWKNQRIVFDIQFPLEYPLKPPKVICKTRIFHPNITEEGIVDSNIRTSSFISRITFNLVCTELLFLFLEPNPDDPMNIEAAAIYKEDLPKFTRIATNFMQGDYSKQ
jgi:ubiquitin-conjugating enzyme E2 M